jgi:hypothetical protein
MHFVGTREMHFALVPGQRSPFVLYGVNEKQRTGELGNERGRGVKILKAGFTSPTDAGYW